VVHTLETAAFFFALTRAIILDGALLTGALLAPSAHWTDEEFLHNRRGLVRFWWRTMALVVMQGPVPSLGHTAAS